MKCAYEKPMVACQRFEANEYIAACGDKGTTYKFTCDAGGGASGKVFLETNGQPGLQIVGLFSEADTYLGDYHACNIEHEADNTDAFLNGYYVPDYSLRATSVLVWRGEGNDNIHCTANLDQNSWETTKS